MKNPPLWLTILIILASMPLFSFPWLLSAIPAGADGAGVVRGFVWIYPFYMLLSGWLAWRAWTHRQEVTWILLTVMLLTTAAIFLLVKNCQTL